MSLHVRTDRRLIRAGAHSRRFVLATVQAPVVTPDPTRRRTPVNLSFVLDRSGSMAGPEIELAKEAVRAAIRHLRVEDRFSIVIYDDAVEIIAESRNAEPAAIREALDRLDRVQPGGSTNLSEGWLRGCDQVARHQRPDGVDRALLLTDGLANVGITDHDVLRHHAQELKSRGVVTTTFGVGADFDEGLLQSLSTAGGGNFYFIADPRQIPDFISSEVGEALEVVARDVVLAVETPVGVAVEAVSPVPCRGGAGHTEFEFGDLVSGEQRNLVLRVVFPTGALRTGMDATFSLTDRAGVFADRAAPLTLRWEYADDVANDAQARDREVDREVARLDAAKARQEAVRLNKSGDYAAAASRIKSASAAIGAYAGDDPEMRAMLQDLDHQQGFFAAPAPPMALKAAHFTASAEMRSRAPSGKARRA